MTTSQHAEARVPVSLAAVGVTCQYGQHVAVRNVTLEVGAGTSVALVGESGSGKTTLLRTFNRLVSPVTGSVTVGGRDVRVANVEALRRSVGYVPQHGGLLPHWRVVPSIPPTPSIPRNPTAHASSPSTLTRVSLPL
ncbi:hypothetical protein BH11GEM1_BH11GEM1_34530 [soil metagenome]